MTFLFVSHALLQRRKQIKRYVRRLKVPGIGVSNVVDERTEGGCSRRRYRHFATCERSYVDAGHETRRNRLCVPLHSTDLSGEQHARMRFHLQSLGEQRGRVDVRIAMDLAVAQKTRILQPWYQPQDALLVGILEVILEADKVVRICAQVLLS